jgi:indolepyruvate ferredoxin oxidoreductase beta subunit
MAQRGGAVQSHLRFSDAEIHSDLIPEGRADMVLSVEPLEALRYWHFLSPEGWVVASTTPHVNIPDYPDLVEVLGKLSELQNLVLVDSGRLAKKAGSVRAQNMVMVGAAAPLLGLEHESMLKYVEMLFSRKGDKVIQVNRRAFDFGLKAGEFFRALIDAGLEPKDAEKVTGKIDPSTLDASLAGSWREAIDGDGKLERLLSADNDVACTAFADYA